MNTYQAALPYATAAFETAMVSQTITEWSNFLQQIALIVKDIHVQMLLKNPHTTRQQLVDFFVELCADTLNVLNERGKNFIKLLAEYHRLDAIERIATLFKHLVETYENRLSALVISAHPLSEKYHQNLAQVLKKRFGREIRLTYNIDKNLIGGLIIRIGDLVIDASIRDKLIRLEESLIAQ